MTIRIKDPVAGPFLLEMVDYKLRVFSYGFWVDQSPQNGPGWYVFGRCKQHLHVIKLVGRPDVPPRVHPHYNIRVQRGWKLKREALAAAAFLNVAYKDWVPPSPGHHAAAVDLKTALEESHRMLKVLFDYIPSNSPELHGEYHATEQVVHHTLDKYKDIK